MRTNRKLGPVLRPVLGVALAAGILTAAGVGVGSASASASPAQHTLRLTSVQLSTYQAGRYEVSAGQDLQNGKATGSDVSTCAANVTTHTAACDVTVARTHGLIYARVTVSLTTGTGKGVVTGGTREFKGATGTVTVSPASQPGTLSVRIDYQV